MTETNELVFTSYEDGVARVTLNRPEVRNALSTDMIKALADAIDDAGSKPDLRTLVLSGTDPCFCAGMDLKDASFDPAAMRVMLHDLALTCLAIRRLPVPTIAQVQGAAVGGGCGLMVVCDFVVTHEEAKLAYPEVDHGICPAVVAPWLVRRIGEGRARAMLLAGGSVNGRAAVDIGLATHLASREALAETVDGLVSRILRGGKHALAATKQWLNELDSGDVEAEVLRGAEISADVLAGDEAQGRLAKGFRK